MPPQKQLDLPPPTEPLKYGLGTYLEAERTALREYIDLLARQHNGDQEVAMRIKQQSEIVLENLRPLQREVANIEKEARAKRLRAWGFGGGIVSVSLWAGRCVASALFPSARETEYAFRHSPRLLLEENVERARSRCKSATVLSLVVIAVLFISKNELVIPACSSLSKQLGNLYAAVKSQDPNVDSDVLETWWWQVLQLSG
ncbi:hypothetical protein B7463_g3831, partial [Scytalidium lignicola]